MTLKEIYKIIDEASCYFVLGRKRVVSLDNQDFKGEAKRGIRYDMTRGRTLVFLKFNDNGEVEGRWVVDHIDKEKKIVTKRLDMMNSDELEKLRHSHCSGKTTCKSCALWVEDRSLCLLNFPFWKKYYFEYKDREFKIEVEE